MSKHVTVAQLAAHVAKQGEALDRLTALVEGLVEADAKAKTDRPKGAKARANARTTTEAKPKAYRSAKGKEQAKADVAALWERTLKDAGVKRAKDLTDRQMAAYRAEAKAIWAAVPKTRTTKA